MQKHQEWLQNRSYQQHLECIKKIKSKKNNIPIVVKKKYHHPVNFNQFKYQNQYKNKYMHIDNDDNKENNIQKEYNPKFKNQNQFEENQQNNQQKHKKFIRNTQNSNNNGNILINNDIFSEPQQLQQVKINNHQNQINYINNKQLHQSKNKTARNFYHSNPNSNSNPNPTCNPNHTSHTSHTSPKNFSISVFPKKPFTSNLPSSRQPQPHSHFPLQQRNSTTYMTLKQKQLLLNNFLLGKRIIQTSPVICKKKHDLEYKKHKELLKSRTSKRFNNTQNANYRLKKLQQHNQKIYKIYDQHRIQYGLHKKYVINLKIQSIQIFKYKFSSFQNIILSMKTGHKHLSTQPDQLSHSISKPQSAIAKKSTIQLSQCIPSSILTSYNFFFSIKKCTLQQNLPVIIEIKNVKSLNVISAGTFSFKFDSKMIVKEYKAKLYNFGKFIGEVKFTASCGRKGDFLAQQS